MIRKPTYEELEKRIQELEQKESERKRSEQALKESEQLYRTIGKTIPYGVWITDATGYCTYASASFLEMVGMTMDQIQQFGWLHLLPPEDVEPTKNHWLHSVQTGEEFEREHRFRSVDGSYRNVLAIGRPVRDEQGNIINWAGLNLDITDRKRMENALRESELQQSRQRHFLETLLNHAQVCIAVMKGRELRYTLVNPAYQALRPQLAMIGRTFRELFPDAAAAGTENLLRKVIETGEPHVARGYHAPIPGKPDAAWDHQIVRLPVVDGKEPSILVIVWDTTDHKRAQEGLEQSNRELEQFAYVASHDLQEPLRAVVGFLQLFESRYGDQLDQKGRHFIERSVNAGHRMQTLIRDLLTLSGVNTKGGMFAPTDLNFIVQNVLDNLQAIIYEKNADTSCAKLPNLTVDASQIQSLFQNLILNALKYNENPKPNIEIGCQEQDNVYQFFVKDNGLGISPEFHQRIFIVFQRLHTDREYPGTGLGLALCKKIVERHGGKIWVESQPEEGSTFHFALPKNR